MPLRKPDITENYIGLGQMTADAIVTMIDELRMSNILLQQDAPLLQIRAQIFSLSRHPDAKMEEVKRFYEKILLPRLHELEKEIMDGRILVIRDKTHAVHFPKIKTFEEIKAELIGVLEGEVVPDAKDAAVDSIIAGDIKLSDIFLPFQREIRGMVLEVLDETIDADEDEMKDAQARGKSFVSEKYGEEIFDILYLRNEEIEREVQAGRIDEEIAETIKIIRENIDSLFASSDMDQARRIRAIKMAHLGVIDTDSDRFASMKNLEDEEGLGKYADAFAALGQTSREQLLAEAAKTMEGKEESVLRSRFGTSQGPDEELEDRKRNLFPDTAAYIREIEAEAFQKMGGTLPKKKDPNDPKGKTPHLRLLKDDE